jgi:hypothetical protein
VSHPPAKRLGSHVDQFQLVGVAHDGVGHRLVLGHPGDPLHDVVEGLQVLEVDGRDDVDAGVEEIVHVLPPLGVLGARRIGVGQLVDQHQLRLPLEQAIQIHLLEGLAPVLGRSPGEDLEVADLGVGVGATVLLHPTDDHVGAALLPAPALVEHGVRLADPGGSAEIQPQLSSCHVDGLLYLGPIHGTPVRPVRYQATPGDAMSSLSCWRVAITHRHAVASEFRSESGSRL